MQQNQSQSTTSLTELLILIILQVRPSLLTDIDQRMALIDNIEEFIAEVFITGMTL